MTNKFEPRLLACLPLFLVVPIAYGDPVANGLPSGTTGLGLRLSAGLQNPIALVDTVRKKPSLRSQGDDHEPVRLALEQALSKDQNPSPVAENAAGSIAVTSAGNAAANANAGGMDDAILRLLRESDQAFSGSAVVLPDLDKPGSDMQLQRRLSLEEMLSRTLQNSYSYAAVNAQADGAGYAKQASLGQLGPAVDMRAQRGREYSAPASVIDPSTGQAAPDSTHVRWDSSIILRQPVFSPASYFDYRKQASLAVSADFRKEDARETLYYQAIKAYYDLLRSYAMLNFARSYAERMESLQDYMNKRMQGGGASKVDYERVRGRALSAKSAVIDAEGTLQSTMVTLAQLANVYPQELGIPTRMMPVVPDSVRLALERIYDSNPSIRAARQDAAAANAELKSARARFSPTFSVELSQSRTRGAGGDDTLTTDRRYMLVMNMNLLNGGSDYYYQKEIGAKFVEKSNTAADIERKVREQIEINYRTLDAINRRVDVARQAYETNKGVADVFLEQLTAGNKQLLDVLDSYQQAYQSRVDLASLLFLKADISYQILRNTGHASAFAEELHAP